MFPNVVWRDSSFRTAVLALGLASAVACAPAPTFRDSSPIDITKDPEQTAIENPHPFTVDRGRYTFRLYPLASYLLRGVTLDRTNYGGDVASALAPCDLAVAWGPMVEGELYRRLSWSQSGRWYWWAHGADFTRDNAFVARYTSNTHMIPISPFVGRAIRSIRRGDLVEVAGELVRVEGAGSIADFRWVSSVSRSDQEAGSCEILYVRRAKIWDRVYR